MHQELITQPKALCGCHLIVKTKIMRQIQTYNIISNIATRPCNASERWYLGSFKRADQGVVNLR